MCGITGYVKLNAESSARNPDLKEMMRLIKYRGPDDEGIYQDHSVALGNVRLSILDVSPAGHQPMESDNGSLVIVYNGEVYNYVEIKKELQEKGYFFRSNSDTEVILAAYQEWGEKCVARFNGMWALAIWDRKNRRFFISRDRFGIKPLFYCRNNGFFVFASEIKCLLAFLNKREINNSYLYGFIDRQTAWGSNETVFKNIYSLLPAHNLVINLAGKEEHRPYWDFTPAEFKRKYDYSRPVDTLRSLLVDAVKLRLRSDVPVGVCLSGGIDSSVITCIISKILKRKIKTFSSIYDLPGYGEKEFIDEVNKECNTGSRLIYPNADNFFEILKSLTRRHDEPVRMPGAYSQWHVFKCAAEDVVVTLDGQGSDELLAGYPNYYPYYLADLIKNFSLVKYFQTRGEIRRCLGKNYDKDVLKIFFPWLTRMNHLFKEKKRWQDQILTDEFIKKYKSSAPERSPKIFSSFLNQELYRSFTNTNLPMLLKNEDRISMTFSIESRVPFLDYRLVEFCFGLDYNQKINGYTSKYILRKAFKDLLPQKIYSRKDKKGFPTPLEYWFRGELKDDLEEIFTSGEFAKNNILDAQKIKRIFSKHLAGQDHSRILWRALVIHFWLGEYF